MGGVVAVNVGVVGGAPDRVIEGVSVGLGVKVREGVAVTVDVLDGVGVKVRVAVGVSVAVEISVAVGIGDGSPIVAFASELPALELPFKPSEGGASVAAISPRRPIWSRGSCKPTRGP